MLNFPKKTLIFIKNHLKKQEEEVDKNLKGVTENDPATDRSVAESSEPGTDAYIADSHTKTLVLESKLKEAKTGIKTALLKIKNGTYGKCENCGKQIETGRLLAMPTAQYCVSCSQKTSLRKR